MPIGQVTSLRSLESTFIVRTRYILHKNDRHCKLSLCRKFSKILFHFEKYALFQKNQRRRRRGYVYSNHWLWNIDRQHSCTLENTRTTWTDFSQYLYTLPCFIALQHSSKALYTYSVKPWSGSSVNVMNIFTICLFSRTNKQLFCHFQREWVMDENKNWDVTGLSSAQTNRRRMCLQGQKWSRDRYRGLLCNIYSKLPRKTG